MERCGDDGLPVFWEGCCIKIGQQVGLCSGVNQRIETSTETIDQLPVLVKVNRPVLGHLDDLAEK